MKKQILLLTVLVIVLNASAQVFVENFVGATVNGNLEGYNGWYVSIKPEDANGVSPKIGEDPLFYANYPGENVGRVAILDPEVGALSATQRISTKRIIFENGDTLKAGSSGALYAAFLVNIASNSIKSYRDFFTWEASEASSFTRGRFFAKNNAEGDEVIFAVTKNSSTASVLDAASTTTLGLTLATGVNHLLVAKYEIIEGASNDIISLYINPDLTKTEAQQTNKLSTSDSQTDYSATNAIKINLRQRGVAGQVGGIRVGRNWDAVVRGIASGLSVANYNYHNMYASGKDIITNASGILKVYALSGTEIAAAKIDGKYSTNLNSGLYLVRFTDIDGVVSSAKIQIK